MPAAAAPEQDLAELTVEIRARMGGAIREIRGRMFPPLFPFLNRIDVYNNPARFDAEIVLHLDGGARLSVRLPHPFYAHMRYDRLQFAMRDVISTVAEAYFVECDRAHPNAIVHVHESALTASPYERGLDFAPPLVRTRPWIEAAREHWQDQQEANAGRPTVTVGLDRNGHRFIEQRYPQPDRTETVSIIRDDYYFLERRQQSPAAGLRRKPDATKRGLKLLAENLTAEQLRSLTELGYFDVRGGDTGLRYRILYGGSMNIIALDHQRAMRLMCLVPTGGLVAGDVMLCQKLALELDEAEAVRGANWFHHLPGQVEYAATLAPDIRQLLQGDELPNG